MHIYRIFYLLPIIFIISCSPRITKSFAKVEDIQVEKFDGSAKNRKVCNDFNNYLPDTLYPAATPVRYVRINIHFINNDAGTANFTKENGGVKYAKDLVYVANEMLKNNQKMNLPLGNNTTVYPANVQYVLTPDPDIPGDEGVYFHTNEKLFYINNQDMSGTFFNPDQYNIYGRQKEKVINVFMMEHHPDSIASPTYKTTENGVGTEHWAKVASAFQKNSQVFYMEGDKPIYKGSWYMAKLFNHELMHTLGLGHSWSNYDGCDDTPPNPNCWNYSNQPPCDKEVSNNMMDYNQCQCALTPCQIGRVQLLLATANSSQNQKLLPVWCERNPGMDITIFNGDSVVWNSIKDLQGNITVNRGATLVVNCKLSLPKDAKIVVKPGAKLIVDGGLITNSCGDKWLGVEIWKSKKEAGAVILKNKGKIEQVEYP